jgi:hypothetical protein
LKRITIQDQKDKEQKEITNNVKNKEDLVQMRNGNSIATITMLKRDLQNLVNQMENDSSVEIEGGPIADEYGNEMNKIENKIESLYKRKNLLQNPVLRSKTLKDLNDKTGIFKNE